MCRVKTVVLREMLGNREICWSLWDGKAVIEMTSKQIADSLKKGEKILGLKVGVDDSLEFDKEGFFCNNIMEHRHCGNYKTMVESDTGVASNLFYICLRAKEENGKKSYNCISTKFERLNMEESDMKAYIRIGLLSAGARLSETGEIEVSPLLMEDKPIAELQKKEAVKESVESKSAEEKTVAKKETVTKPEVKTISVETTKADKKGK